LRVEKISEKETRIHPNIPLIKREVEAKRVENLEFGNKQMRILNHGAKVDHPPQRLVDSVAVSESLARQTSKARAPQIESTSISDGVSISVTHANPKKEPSDINIFLVFNDFTVIEWLIRSIVGF
jgi:hypothetical protein